MTPAYPPHRARPRPVSLLLALLLFLISSPVLSAPELTWSEDLYNPRPQPDDVLLPLPCGGAMAFRWVEATGRVPARAPSELTPLYRLIGPFTRAGSRYLLIGKYEITQLQYQALQAHASGATCPRPTPAGRQVQGRIGWHDAIGLASDWSRWLRQNAEQIPACTPNASPCLPRIDATPAFLRLPREAEWEYAARGGRVLSPAQFAAPTYPMPDGRVRHAWYSANAEGKLRPIGYRAANPLGLHDLYGNVEELMLDPYHEARFPGQVGAAVVRGGSVHATADALIASRRREVPLYGPEGAVRAPDNGFRLVVAGPLPERLSALAPALPPPNAPAGRTGHLQINVDTPAEVRLDGHPVGQASPGAPVNLSGLTAGAHEITVSADGYAPVSERHPIQPNRWTQVAVVMRPLGAVRTPEPEPEPVVAEAEPEPVVAEAEPEPVAPEPESELMAPTLEPESAVLPDVLSGISATSVQSTTSESEPTVASDTGSRQAVVNFYLVLAVLLTAGIFWVSYQRAGSGKIGLAVVDQLRQRVAALRRETNHIPTAPRKSKHISIRELSEPTLLKPEHPFEPVMIALPGGTFWMGSPEDEPERYNDEGPRHKVRIQPFAIGKYAVTFDQYDYFARETGRQLPGDAGWGRGKRPVIDVSWHDAVAYADWLSEQTDRTYRLPTEAEWEYAARAGTTTPFWTGRCIHTDQANYNGNYDYNGCGAKTGVRRGKTVKVGSLPANPWGLHEVHGNVREWVQDQWHVDYHGAPADGSAWEAGNDFRRVVRGGSWSNIPRLMRSAYRIRYRPENRTGGLGFRLARTLPT